MSGKRNNLVCAMAFEAKNAEKMANSSRETRREIIRATSLGNFVKALFIPEFPFASESYVNLRSAPDIYSRFFGITHRSEMVEGNIFAVRFLCARAYWPDGR